MLAENLVIIGGTASTLGLRHRLLAEVRTLAASEAYSKVVKIDSFKIHNPPAKANYVAWLGGKTVIGWMTELERFWLSVIGKVSQCRNG